MLSREQIRNRAATLGYGSVFVGFWWGGRTCLSPGAPSWLPEAFGSGGLGLVVLIATVYALGKRHGANKAEGEG